MVSRSRTLLVVFAASPLNWTCIHMWGYCLHGYQISMNTWTFFGECKFAILHRKIPWRVCVSFFSGLIRRVWGCVGAANQAAPLWQITGYLFVPGWSPAKSGCTFQTTYGCYIICKMFCSGMYTLSFAPKHIPPLNVFTDTNHFGGELKNMMPRFCCIFMWVRTQELWYLGVKEAQFWDSDSSVFKLCEHHVGQNIDI